MIYMGPHVQFLACTESNKYSNRSMFDGQALLGSHVTQKKIALKNCAWDKLRTVEKNICLTFFTLNFDAS